MQESKCGDLNNGRRTVALGSGLEKLLSAYASAAVTAGVSLLAMTNSVEAKVIYTPARTNIPGNSKGGFILLDLNHDGIADFSFWNQTFEGEEGEFNSSLVVGCAPVPVSRSSSTCRYQGNEIWGRGVVSGRFASALRSGFRVGANKSYFQPGHKRRNSYVLSPVAVMGDINGAAISGFPYSATSGQWMYTKRRYLGFKFIINGQIHYGWARLSVSLIPPTPAQARLYVTLTGYAYETVPNKPIITGKIKGPDVVTLDPATLGHLAQGASAIPAWRVKQTAALTH